jgi:hypothetical protein
LERGAAIRQELRFLKQYVRRSPNRPFPLTARAKLLRLVWMSRSRLFPYSEQYVNRH